MNPRREFNSWRWGPRGYRAYADRTWREGRVGGHGTWLHARAGDEKRQ